jgi:LysR family transcriptional regulator, regulator of abg operon
MSMNLRLHQLRALVGVVEHGGIRAAARQMFISQAALTKSLRQLEDDAGVTLLVRSPRGVSLTQAGQRLLARANLVTRQLDLAAEELREAAGEQSGQVRVALTPYITLRHLGPAFRTFRQRYPGVAVELVEGLVARVLPRLRDGSLDLAIVADTGDLPIGEFESQPVLSTRQHVVVRDGHPVLAHPTPQALGQLEWILSGPRDGLKSSRLKAIFARAGVAPPERILLCDTLAGLALLRGSDVAGIVPAPILGEPEGRGMVAVDVPELDPGELRLVLLTRPDVPLTPAGAYFARCLVDSSQGPARAA